MTTEEKIKQMYNGYGGVIGFTKTEMMELLTTYRAQVLEEVKQWAKSNARTKDTAMSDFEENHVWDVDYHELVEFLKHPTN